MKDYLRPLFAKPTTVWSPWFAWHPSDTSDRGWVWLRRIYRRRCQVHSYLEDGGSVYWQTAVDPFLTQMRER